jgi:hypothetical protein
MSKFTEDLVNGIDTISAALQFGVLVGRIAQETGQSIDEARADLAASIAGRTREGRVPATAYERILDDVANGRPRPRNFDASGP